MKLHQPFKGLVQTEELSTASFGRSVFVLAGSAESSHHSQIIVIIKDTILGARLALPWLLLGIWVRAQAGMAQLFGSRR
eukprot:1143529-Pelagomonas_calceolata.AAC.5